MIIYYTHLPSKAVMVESFKTMQYTQYLSLMLLYLCPVLVRLLLVNVIDLSMMLPGAASLGYVTPSLVCNKVAQVQFQMHQSSGTRVLFHCRISCIHHLLLVISPCQIEFGKIHSISIMLCLMPNSGMVTYVSGTRRICI